MNFLEKDLERILEEQLNNDPEVLYDLGLEHIDYDLKTKVFRQLRIGNYGIADLVTVQRYMDNIIINVYELKKGVINEDALFQCSAYAKGIKSYLDKRGVKKYTVRKVLIGSSVETSGRFPFIFDEIQRENFTDTSIYSFDFKIDGIRFEWFDLVGYDLIDKGF
jgi:DNA-directed RNA polymerase subunit N (RpoN/RPB10)